MKPLLNSHVADDLERDLRNLFVQMYDEYLADQADEINLYGAPHIGPFSLVEREVAKDGLAVLRTTDIDAIRYLFKAFRFRNPRRGLHFLRLYVRILFGEAHDINLMWQRKDKPYPTALLDNATVTSRGLEAEHFLTSRVHVDIDSDFLTASLKQVLMTTVAARFVLQVRSAKYGRSTLSIGGGSTGLAVLNATNMLFRPPYKRPPREPDGFGTPKQMIKDLFAFLVRATGEHAMHAGMPELITAEGMVKNNQFVGGALGGYTADGVASSEGISLVMRGLASAYAVDKDPEKLAYIKFLMDAACKYFYFDTRPSANAADKWYHTWMVNAGPEFKVRGPLAANGQLDQGGFIGKPVEFTAGVGLLDPAPDIVYQVVTSGTLFVWDNVFSEIQEGTGSQVEVDYYVDKDGNKIYGVQKGGSFGQPSEPNSGEQPGKIVLKTAVSGTYGVNYCVTVDDVTIAHGEPYEAWPMWRKLANGERAIAADAIHWFADVFRLMRIADPDNVEWRLAHERTLDVWRECCEQESNNTKIFSAGSSGPYNNFPLTYSYVYGVENVDDGSTHWDAKPPTPYYSAQRTADGYVTFQLPEDFALAGSGGRMRYGCVFENKPLYLTYDASSVLKLDTNLSFDAVVMATITSEQGDKFHAPLLCGPQTKTVSVPLWQFMRFEDKSHVVPPVPEVPCWRPGAAVFTFGNPIARTNGEMTNAYGKALTVSTFAIPDTVSGFGFSSTMVEPNLVLTEPPVLCYSTYDTLTLTLRDSQDWLWVAECPVQPMLGERRWSWSDFTLSAFQDPAKAALEKPTAPSGSIQGYQFNGKATISIAYVSGVTPNFAKPQRPTEQSAVVEVARWLPGEQIFDFNLGVARTLGTSPLPDGKSIVTSTFTIPDSKSGFGITRDMVTPFLELTQPPTVCYSCTVDFSLSLKDGNGWLWVATCPAQPALAERTWTWADFALSSYQEDSKAGQPAPSAPTGVIQLFQFTGAPGVHGPDGQLPQAITMAYLSSVSPTRATSGNIRIFTLLNPIALEHTWKVGNVTLEAGQRRPVAYYGSLPFGLMIGGPSRARLAVIPFRGPYIAGYQSGTPWVDLGDAVKLGGMLDFMAEAQHQFTLRSPERVEGPFMHVYLPATWDSEQYGILDTWVWDGPDGNPAWTGWQYRAFDAMAHTWRLMVARGMDVAVTAKAAAICNKFLTWLHDWVSGTPISHYVPSDWGPAGWSQGIPFPPSGYLDPHGHALESHDLALVLKGAIFCALACADQAMCRVLIERAMGALAIAQVRNPVDPMSGAFTMRPNIFECYSFHQGEVMDALAIAMQNELLLPEHMRSQA